MNTEILQKWKPSTVVWEITRPCNLSCVHCGSTAGPKGTSERELSFEESLSLAKDLKELGTKRLILSGAEPFLSPYWKSLALFVIDLGIIVHFVSNGLLKEDGR